MAGVMRRLAFLTVAAATAALPALAPGPTAQAGGVVVREIEITEPGPLGPVTVVGDSVLVGAAYAPSLPVRLAELGWGPIRFRASGGGSTGFHLDDRHEASLRNWVRWWRERGWDAPTVIVNLGANDAGICSGNVAECAAAIRHMLDQIGPTPTVVWGKITHLNARHAAAWNTALDQVAAERTNLLLWDWPTAQQVHGIALSGDRIHLGGKAPYAKRSAVMAQEITDLVAVARPEPSAVTALPRAATRPATYEPVAPRRLLDTRRDPLLQGRPVAAGRQLRISLTGKVPRGTTAVAVGITATGTTADGDVRVWSCAGDAPETSMLTTAAGGDRAAQAVVAASDALCLRSSTATHLVVDLQGAFTSAATGSRLRAVTPRRLIDTRGSTTTRQVSFNAPSGATAVAITVTATEPRGTGYVSAHACGGDADVTSLVNMLPGDTVAGTAFVATGRDGRVCVTASTDTHLMVDLTGSFHRGTSGLRFVAVAPTRVLDTRRGTGGWRGLHGRGQRLDLIAAPAGAEAVTGTLTQIAPATQGHLSATPCTDGGNTSSVNTARGQVRAVSVTVQVSAQRRLCVTASTPGQTAFDLTGYWRR